MSRRLLGWLPALVIAAITGVAFFFLGAWKTAGLLAPLALIAAPVRWAVPGLSRLSAQSMERGMVCLILCLIGLVVLGVETLDARDERREAAQPARAVDPRNAPPPEPDGAEYEEAAAEGEEGAASAAPRGTPPLLRRVSGEMVRLAIDNARSCDRAHLDAAGALARLDEEPAASADARAAVAAAATECETSWISFNRPELRGDPARNYHRESDALHACDRGYLGRWLANDNLLGALDRGASSEEIGRIRRMNSANDTAVEMCGTMLSELESAGA